MSRSVDATRGDDAGAGLRELRLRLSRSGFAALGVEELLALHEECDHVRLRSLSCTGTTGTVTIETDRPVETEWVVALDYVDRFDLVGHGPDRYEYLLCLELPTCRETLDERDGEFYVDGPLHLDDEGLTFTAVATQDALDALDATWACIEDFEAAFDVLRIGSYSGRAHRVEALTDRQREVLETAFERGYFDVPRGVTPEELAAEFDLDKSTVLEHLRRAQRNLLESTFERGGGGVVR